MMVAAAASGEVAAARVAAARTCGRSGAVEAAKRRLRAAISVVHGRQEGQGRRRV